jgi:hypothetical protein
MTLYDEFNDFFKELGPLGTASFKFFDGFKFNNETKTISFHKDFEYTLEDELFEQLRIYVKQEKATIRKLQKDLDLKQTKRKMLFFFMKLQENGIFEVAERKYILIYTDFCLDATI